MNNKRRKYLKFIVIPLILLAVLFIVYYLLDAVSLGVIAEWFDKMFIYETTSETADGETVITRNISWGSVKMFLFYLFAGIIMFSSWIVIIVYDMIQRRNRSRHSHLISEYLHRFIIKGEPVPPEMPQEDSEVISAVTEIKLEMNRSETLLRDESRRKDDLITYLAHDLKTPLTSVIGYLALLRDEPDLPAGQKAKYIGIAVKKAERLEELISELFEISRFSLSDTELVTEKINISRMLEQIASEFEPLLAEKSLHIRTDITPDIMYVCDVNKIERVFDNLLRNAVNYSSAGTEIKISLKCCDDVLRIVFENHGKTIPAQKLNRLFEQFYRMDQSRSSSTGGSGLGLAIAKQFIEAHNGSISAESEDETVCFTVILPLDKTQP